MINSCRYKAYSKDIFQLNNVQIGDTDTKQGFIHFRVFSCLHLINRSPPFLISATVVFFGPIVQYYLVVRHNKIFTITIHNFTINTIYYELFVPNTDGDN